MDRPFLLAVMGPTASGKTALAEELASRTEAQLINADAFQVYRGLDIGTGKPPDKARYRLLDLVEPDEEFGLGEWVRLALSELESLWQEGRSAILVGGSGLYVRALMEEFSEMSVKPDEELRRQLALDEAEIGPVGMAERLKSVDPAAATRVDLANPRRVSRALEKALSPAAPIRVRLPEFRKFKVGLNPEPAFLDALIRGRLDQMLAAGWIDEVSHLISAGYSSASAGFRAIGYRQIADVVLGKLDQPSAEELVVVATRQYAKRQRTWLRREPALNRLSASSLSEQVADVERLLRSHHIAHNSEGKE